MKSVWMSLGLTLILTGSLVAEVLSRDNSSFLEKAALDRIAELEGQGWTLAEVAPNGAFTMFRNSTGLKGGSKSIQQDGSDPYPVKRMIPHFGVGRGNGLEIKGELVTMNMADERREIRYSFYDDSGEPFIIKSIGFNEGVITGNQMLTSLSSMGTMGEMILLCESGDSQGCVDNPTDVKAGWVYVETTKSCEGCEPDMQVQYTYLITDSNSGVAISAEGVPMSEAGKDFDLHAMIWDGNDRRSVGIGLANPSDELWAIVDAQLWNGPNIMLSKRSILLAPREHRAMFLEELFDNVTEPDAYGNRLTNGRLLLRSLEPIGVIGLKAYRSPTSFEIGNAPVFRPLVVPDGSQ